MSLRNVTKPSYLLEPQQVSIDTKYARQKLIAEISLLVLVFFVGLGFLVWGGIQSIVLVTVVGYGLISVGFLGIVVIAGLLIRLAKRKEKLLLISEQKLLGQAETSFPRSFMIEDLIQKLGQKELELKNLEKTFKAFVDRYQKDIQMCSEQFTNCTRRIDDLEKEKKSLQKDFKKLTNELLREQVVKN